jgi:hypothetical protein
MLDLSYLKNDLKYNDDTPSIPVCLLYNKSKFNNTNFHYIHENKNINELTSPYIII